MEVVQTYIGPFPKDLVLEVQAADVKYFDLPWDLKSWEELGPTYQMSILRGQTGDLQGFTLFQCLPFEDMAHLLKILVLPDFRRHKLGKKLLLETISAMLHDKERIFLEVSDRNSGALQFYLSFGFEKINHNKNYYSSGDGAFSMELYLKKLVKQ